MKRRSFLRSGLLVAFALVMVASMPLAVSADHVDDRDQDEGSGGLQPAPFCDSGDCVNVPKDADNHGDEDGEDVYVNGPVRIDGDDNHDQSATPSDRTGYTEPVDRVEYECACFSPNKEAAKELADVGAYDAIEEIQYLDAAEFLEDYEGVDPSEVLDDQDGGEE